MPEETRVEPGRRERKRQQQLEHLARTAWALFEREGFEAVTMERIAEAADLSKVTLYKHFPVKEAILAHLFHLELREGWPMIQAELALQPAGRRRLGRFLELQAAWCTSRRPFPLPYVAFRLGDTRRPAEGRERSGMGPIFAELVAQGQRTGDLRDDVPAALLAHQLQFLHLATLLRWLLDERLSLADELARMLQLACEGMGSRA